MTICEEGFLNQFVKSVAEGGWGVPEYIVSIMAENRGYTIQEFYDTIQASGLDASVKALSLAQIRQICEWMVGKEFTGVEVGNYASQSITYEYVPGTRAISKNLPKNKKK